MAKQIINVGQEVNDGTGDPIRTAWQKANLNFTELYDKFDDFTFSDISDIVDGSAGDVLTTDGNGNFTFEAPGASSTYGDANVNAHLNTSTAANNEVLAWTGADYDWVKNVQLSDITLTVAAAANTSTMTYNPATGAFIYVPLNGNQFAAVADLPTDLTDLGITDGANGQILTTDGAGNFTFEDAPAGGGSSGTALQSRTTKSGTTASLANNASGNLDITGFKGYALMAIQTDKAAWVRIYANGASRTADASRAETSDPAPDAGVIAEVITTGAETVLISPGTIGYNFESTPNTTIPCAVKNKSGSTGTVQVTLTVLQLEG